MGKRRKIKKKETREPALQKPSLVKWVFTRAVVLYLLVYLLQLVMVDYEKIHFGIKIRTLNVMMPKSYNYLIELEDFKRRPSKELHRYRYYYEKMIDTFPKSSDAHGLLGFCYFHLRHHDKAVASYKKAIEINDKVFWYPYNLGAIYYKQGRYEEAIPMFKSALATNPRHTMTYAKASEKVLLPIIVRAEDQANELKRRLTVGYRNAYTLLCLSYYRLKDYSAMFQTAERALKANAGLKDLFYLLGGVAAYEQKDLKNSLLFLSECVKMSSDNTLAYHYLGQAYRDLGRRDEARENFSKSQSLLNTKGNMIIRDDKIGLRLF